MWCSEMESEWQFCAGYYAMMIEKVKTMAIATSDDGLRATSQQTHRVSTSDGTRKEGIGIEGLVRGSRPEGEERGRRGATVPLTPPKLLDNTDAK